MAIKIPTSSIARPSKIDTNWYFWFWKYTIWQHWEEPFYLDNLLYLSGCCTMYVPSRRSALPAQSVTFCTMMMSDLLLAALALTILASLPLTVIVYRGISDRPGMNVIKRAIYNFDKTFFI
jgi:hypothetical protein